MIVEDILDWQVTDDLCRSPREYLEDNASSVSINDL